jgi:hypothetical protein
MGWLDTYFTRRYTTIQIAGVALPPETTINFASGATGADNSAQARSDITIGGSQTFTLPKINDTSSNHTYDIVPSELAANRIVTLPLLLAGDTFVFADHIQTLTSKTLTSPTIGGTPVFNCTQQTNTGLPLCVEALYSNAIVTAAVTPVSVLDLTLNDNCHSQIDVVVTCCRRTAVTKGGTFKLSVGYMAASGALTICGALVQSDEQVTAGSVTISVLAATVIQVIVTPADTDSRNWSAFARIQPTVMT